MKTTILIIEILTGLLLFTTIICGLWLGYSNEIITESNKNFHMVSAFLTTIFAVITVVLISRN